MNSTTKRLRRWRSGSVGSGLADLCVCECIGVPSSFITTISPLKLVYMMSLTWTRPIKPNQTVGQCLLGNTQR